jgi:hypothetical protein
VDRPFPIPPISFERRKNESDSFYNRLDNIEPSGHLPPSSPIRALVSASELDETIEDGETDD